MNKHLNIFKTYTEIHRRYQLENDLTRALAICLQEDTLFFHEVLKAVFNNSNLYNTLFEDLDNETIISIEIQQNVKLISEFEHVFAVSLSENEMSDFWSQTHNLEYDPICDLVITINNILIVIEAKRDNVDCTAQLYNQILNIFKKQDIELSEYKEQVTPFDLNWPKLMAIAVKAAGFEKTVGNQNRFLNDFIQLVKDHNFRWLPEPPLASLIATNRDAIKRRLESAVNQFCNNIENVSKLNYHDRLGCSFSKGWANEVLFDIDAQTGDLVALIYPGNTKGQGYSIFQRDPEFSEALEIKSNQYKVNKSYHVKFSGQSYITGLWFSEDKLKQKLYTSSNFHQYTGRIKKPDWATIEKLLDDSLDSHKINWREESKWNSKIIQSNRSQFNISFGYEISIRIPFNTLKAFDTDKKDIENLSGLIGEIYNAFENQLIK
jgi:hypothetical protein